MPSDCPSAVVRDSKVIVANRSARRYGVKVGSPPESLRAYCPAAQIIEYDLASVQLWQQTVLALLAEFSHSVEFRPPHWAFLVMPAAVSPEQMVQMIAEKLSLHSLRSAIGVAPGRLSSMIACRLSQVSRQRITILSSPLKDSLAKLPLSLLPSRFNNLVNRCHLMGWHRFEDIARTTLQQAKSMLGTDVVELWALSQGYDQQKIDPNYPPTKMEWKGTLPAELTPQSLRTLSKRLAGQINRFLQKELAEATQLCLSLYWGGFNQSRERILKSPTREPKVLESQLHYLWEQMLAALHAHAIELWEESTWRLCVHWKPSQTAKQLSLETAFGCDDEQIVAHAIERLNKRSRTVVASLSKRTLDWEAAMRDFYRESNLSVYDPPPPLRYFEQDGDAPS